MLLKDCRALILDRRALALAVRRRLPDAWFRRDNTEREALVLDLEMHLAYLGEALRLHAPRLFTEYAAWTSQLEADHDTPRFAACLSAIEAELRASGTGDWLREAEDVISRARERLAEPVAASAPGFTVDNPHHELSEAFLRACLELRRGEALAMLRRAASGGTSVEAIYTQVITPAMHELGRLWQLNRVTIGQEHYCTAVAQVAMANLLPTIFAGREEPLGRVVAVCAAGELHEIGARMVADLFEVNGWDTVFLGADVPPSSVVDMLVEVEADVLAISATLSANLGHVTDLIEAVRHEPECAHVKVLVGGAAFAVEPDVWRKVGADAAAASPAEALASAHAWRR